ncbi:interferon-induced protein with tetratricopeptide repeats 5-like [Phyllobates terribilis]|uniref:interferon-induced protein with tetratricopeptide repeats 5-like n=1 Tax=Phyllobates terribilis TaxID=111132 RepID=UPI003CCAC4BA
MELLLETLDLVNKTSWLLKDELKSRLPELKCHFTWSLLGHDTDPEELEVRLYDQLTFLVTKNKHMVYNLLAYVIHLKGDTAKAIATLEKAEQIIKENNPDRADQKYLVTYGNYAWVYFHMQQYEDALKYMEKAEKIYKELRCSKVIAEIYGEKGWSLLKFSRKYYEKAKQCFEKALELDPEDPEWNTGYATVIYKL